MKTIRISYATKEASTTDLQKTFSIREESLGKEVNAITDNDLQAKFPDCHAHFVDDITVDMLVPDNFDVSQLGGTIIKSDGESPLHEWLGHSTTRMVIDKTGRIEEPIKVSTKEETIKEVVVSTK